MKLTQQEKSLLLFYINEKYGKREHWAKEQGIKPPRAFVIEQNLKKKGLVKRKKYSRNVEILFDINDL